MYIHANTMPFIILFIICACVHIHMHVIGVCSPVLMRVEVHSLMERVFLDLARLFLEAGSFTGPSLVNYSSQKGEFQIFLSLPSQHWGYRHVPGFYTHELRPS